MTGAIDIGGTKIAAGMVDESGRVRSKLECPTAPERGFADGLLRMTAMLRVTARQAGAAVTGIGIGSTGPVDPFRGTIEKADLLPGWEGGELVRLLAERFGVPAALENDADAAALAEAAWGAGRYKERFIYLTLSTGIGSGIIFGGKIYRGVEGAHPEFGHHVVDVSGPPCYCGARGCWETFASGPAMAAWVKAQAPAGAFEGQELTAREVCRLAETGVELAVRAVERFGYYLGLGLANVITMFAPDAIALGGGLMKSSHLFLDRAREVIRRNCAYVPHEKTLITPALLGDDVGLAGAARVWHYRCG